MSKAENFPAVISEWFSRDISIVHEREVDIPLNLEVVVSIIGPRRSGKTHLMYNFISKLLKFLLKKNVLYVNLEREKLRHITVEYLSDLIAAYYELLGPDRNKPIYLFLDEIQAVNGWCGWVLAVKV